MPVYLIRHGQSEFNAAFDINGADPRIHDARLTAKGRQQASVARAKAQELNKQMVISSPLTRALQTEQLIFGATHSIVVDAGAREMVGHSCDIGRSRAELQADFPDLVFDHLPDIWWHTGIPNDQGYTIEPADVHQARGDDFIRALADMTPRPFAVVGHGDTFKAMTGKHMKNGEILRFRR